MADPDIISLLSVALHDACEQWANEPSYERVQNLVFFEKHKAAVDFANEHWTSVGEKNG